MGLSPLLRCPYDCRRSSFRSLRALNEHVTKYHGRKKRITLQDFLRVLTLKRLPAWIIIVPESE